MTSTAMPATWKPVPTALAACLKSIACLQICQNRGPAILTPIRTNLRAQGPIRRAPLEELGGVGMLPALVHLAA